MQRAPTSSVCSTECSQSPSQRQLRPTGTVRGCRNSFPGKRASILFLLLLTALSGVRGQQITYRDVTTATELQAAVAANITHIYLKDHIDFEGAEAFAPEGRDNGWYSYTVVIDATHIWSVVGRCQKAPPFELAAPWKTGTCVVRFHDQNGFFVTEAMAGALPVVRPQWFDRLYVLMSTTGLEDYWGFTHYNLGTNLYLTDLTFESQGHILNKWGAAIHLEGPNTVAWGLQVRNFLEPSREPVQIYTKTSMIGSTFFNNTLVRSCENYWSITPPCGAGVMNVENAVLRLQESTFTGNKGVQNLNDTSDAPSYDIAVKSTSLWTRIYSDKPMTYLVAGGFRGETLPIDDADSEGFLTIEDPEYLSLKFQVDTRRPAPAIAPAAEPSPTSDSGDDSIPPSTDLDSNPAASGASDGDTSLVAPSSGGGSDGNVGVIAGSTVAAVVLLAALLAGLLLLRRRRASNARAGDGVVGSQHTDASAHQTSKLGSSSQLKTGGTIAVTLPTQSDVNPASPALGPRSPMANHSTAWNHGSQIVTMTDSSAGGGQSWQGFDATYVHFVAGSVSTNTMPTNASTKDALDTVEGLDDALEEMFKQKELLMGRWQVLDATERRVGGQGLVQFLRDASTGQEYVVKFFLIAAAFQQEVQLYKQPHMREMMAAVVMMQENADGSIRAPNGLALPSFIVLEKGRSLDEWALITKPDYVTTLQVLVQVVERLRALHAAGLVHRDIKPANILWRTQVGTWTLIDFGCTAVHGEPARLAFSVPYAPPEVARAIREARSTVTVDTSIDMWALGVVIYELIVGSRAFKGKDVNGIVDALTGSEPLPWEPGHEREGQLKSLGMLRKLVQLCLSRDPSERPSADKMLAALNHKFLSETSVATNTRTQSSHVESSKNEDPMPELEPSTSSE